MVYLFLANGFEESEAMVPLDILRRAGAKLVTVGIGSRRVVSSHGVEMTADIEDKDFKPEDMEMVILPGGIPGTPNLEKSPVVRAAVEECVKRRAYLAAICAAPSILGHWGYLKEHRATCNPDFADELGALEATGEPVCVSGKVITARGAGVAAEFGFQLAEVLFGRQKTEDVRKKMQCI